MDNERFPCGPWVGFYCYERTDRHRMDLHLTFANGSMTGAGSDDLGRFLVRGRYDSANGECYWTKTYIDAHDVFYRGFRDGKGIWGMWEIGAIFRGGFHIWPRAAEEGAQAAVAGESEELLDAVGTEMTSPSADPRLALNKEVS